MLQVKSFRKFRELSETFMNYRLAEQQQHSKYSNNKNRTTDTNNREERREETRTTTTIKKNLIKLNNIQQQAPAKERHAVVCPAPLASAR